MPQARLCTYAVLPDQFDVLIAVIKFYLIMLYLRKLSAAHPTIYSTECYDDEYIVIFYYDFLRHVSVVVHSNIIRYNQSEGIHEILFPIKE
jgi:hypothetical protein